MKENYPYTSGMTVSAAFYSRIRQRVSSIFVNLGGHPEPAREKEVMYLVNVYLGAIARDKRHNKINFLSRVVFESLRAEIDAAMERSRRARARAAARRNLVSVRKSRAAAPKIHAARPVSHGNRDAYTSAPAQPQCEAIKPHRLLSQGFFGGYGDFA